MALSQEEINRIKEALIMTAHYTGDTEYKRIFEKIKEMEKEWEEEKKRRRKL